MTQIKFTEFCEGDWMAFSGAEKPGNEEPLIGEMKVTLENGETHEAVIIVDGNGISLECVDEEFTFSGDGYNLEMKPFKTAVTFAKNILCDEMGHAGLLHLGFSSY